MGAALNYPMVIFVLQESAVSNRLADRPITQAEVDVLADLLIERAIPYDGMSLEMLDGFFSALVVGPDIVMPSEYLPHVWGDAPAWEDLAHAQQGLAVVMRLWNHIAWRVRQPFGEDDDMGLDPLGDPLLVPFVDLPDALVEHLLPNEDADDSDLPDKIPEDFPLGAAWGSGFMRGVALRLEQWQAWAAQHSDFAEDIGLIFILSAINREHAQEMQVDAEDVMDLKDRWATVMEIPGMLHQMHLQRLHDQHPRPLRRAPIPGRNDACSCGSGKKYKKCCGDGAKLH